MDVIDAVATKTVQPKFLQLPEQTVYGQTQDKMLKPKKALPFLPFEAEECLTARIEGQALVIRKA